MSIILGIGKFERDPAACKIHTTTRYGVQCVWLPDSRLRLQVKPGISGSHPRSARGQPSPIPSPRVHNCVVIVDVELSILSRSDHDLVTGSPAIARCWWPSPTRREVTSAPDIGVYGCPVLFNVSSFFELAELQMRTGRTTLCALSSFLGLLPRQKQLREISYGTKVSDGGNVGFGSYRPGIQVEFVLPLNIAVLAGGLSSPSYKSTTLLSPLFPVWRFWSSKA